MPKGEDSLLFKDTIPKTFAGVPPAQRRAPWTTAEEQSTRSLLAALPALRLSKDQRENLLELLSRMTRPLSQPLEFHWGTTLPQCLLHAQRPEVVVRRKPTWDDVKEHVPARNSVARRRKREKMALLMQRDVELTQDATVMVEPGGNSTDAFYLAKVADAKLDSAGEVLLHWFMIDPGRTRSSVLMRRTRSCT